jgi:hypothetical protein
MDEMKNGGEMQKGKTTCACGAGCSCGCGHHCMHRVIWWVVGIIILVFVFALGVKAGEFRDELRGTFGNYYREYPMMQGTYNGGGVAVPVGTAAGSPTGTTGNGLMIPAQQ